ncbi:hypothetical protein [Streptomyces lushanensis]|uniref:hypothetical protein n=1 Tax=Streptomyces lushanensis TaxID=1434255 RepID=UPI00082C5932|nr:hypothetical protein [Streptomyces lushanensis]
MSAENNDDIKTMDNHTPSTPAKALLTTMDNHTPSTPANGLTTMDNHTPILPPNGLPSTEGKDKGKGEEAAAEEPAEEILTVMDNHTPAPPKP